jgi:hypothetical protein
MGRNAEGMERKGTFVLASLALLMAAFFYAAFDEWTLPRIIFLAALAVVALGLGVYAASPTKGWWGLRVVTFVIASACLWYVMYLSLLQPAPSTIEGQKGVATPFNALMGFFFFGVPCLVYTLWGTTMGRVTDPEAERLTRGDWAVFYLSWGCLTVYCVFGLLSLAKSMFGFL